MIRFPKGRDTYSKSIGIAATILASSAAKKRDFEYVERILRPATRHEQIGFISTRHYGETGFFVWGYLHPFTIQKILKNGKFELSESDWSEDGEPVIIDLVSAAPLLKELVRAIYSEISKKCVQDFGHTRPVSRITCKSPNFSDSNAIGKLGVKVVQRDFRNVQTNYLMTTRRAK